MQYSNVSTIAATEPPRVHMAQPVATEVVIRVSPPVHMQSVATDDGAKLLKVLGQGVSFSAKPVELNWSRTNSYRQYLYT